MSLTDDRPRQRELVIERVFDAARELVFRMWTEPKHMTKWWGPRDYPAGEINADVRPGGKYRHCLISSAGDMSLWLYGTFQEIVPPERLVFTFAWEEEGERGLETVVTIVLKDEGNKTRMLFRQSPFQSQVAWVDGFSNAGVFVLLAIGLNIVVGVAGLLDLGYAAFFAIGAYAMGLLNSPVLGSPLYGHAWSFWVCIWVAAAVSALLEILDPEQKLLGIIHLHDLWRTELF